MKDLVHAVTLTAPASSISAIPPKVGATAWNSSLPAISSPQPSSLMFTKMQSGAPRQLLRNWAFPAFRTAPACWRAPGSSNSAIRPGLRIAPRRQFKGLEAPFLEVAGPTASDRTDKKWFPLLFFNSTDVDTGRRIVVSPVASHIQLDGQPEARIFADAYDFHDLIADTPTSEKGRKLEEQAAQFEGTLDRDISLSTAALLSARFPIISPPGVVLNRKGKVVARIVDGGYFENFGAATAQELAQQLKQAGLSSLHHRDHQRPGVAGRSPHREAGDRCGRPEAVVKSRTLIPCVRRIRQSTMPRTPIGFRIFVGR